LRGGEIAGVRIRAVDFLRREMTITEQSKTGTSAFEWAPLKTAAAHRVLPLSDMALEAIAEELAENPCADRSMPVFRTMHGRMWSSSTVSHSFRAVRNRLGLDPAITWHSLRHFYASALIHAVHHRRPSRSDLVTSRLRQPSRSTHTCGRGRGSAPARRLMRHSCGTQCGTGSSSDAESDETVPAELDSTGTGE
ncbi:tyrosine-type recombinase/integrase, partial [Rhodococcus hoagii]|nr:tyrosine-type recombinase/integrase [Prescottella equi]